jgi:hypothetical protein
MEELQRELDEIRERERELYNEIRERLIDRMRQCALVNLQVGGNEFTDELEKALDQRDKWHVGEVEKARKRYEDASSHLRMSRMCHGEEFSQMRQHSQRKTFKRRSW